MDQNITQRFVEEEDVEYCVSLNPTVDKAVVVEKLTPGAVNRAVSVSRSAGGKAVNVALLLKTLKRDPKVVGVNSKIDGEALRLTLEDRSIFYDFHDVNAPSRENTKIFDKETKQTTEINEPGIEVSADLLGRISDEVVVAADSGQAVVLAGALPPDAPDTYYADLVKRLNEKKVRVIVDTAGAALKEAVKEHPYMIKPNLEELDELVGKDLKTVGDVQSACTDLMKEYGIEIIIVSLGSKGIYMQTKDEQMYAPALAVEVSSTVGGGDSVVAGAVAYMNATPDTMLRAAVAASAGTVTLEGTELCTPELFETNYNEVVVQEPQADLVLTED